jgi:hypothetical protein
MQELAKRMVRRTETERVKKPPEPDLRVVFEIDLQERLYCDAFANTIPKMHLLRIILRRLGRDASRRQERTA